MIIFLKNSVLKLAKNIYNMVYITRQYIYSFNILKAWILYWKFKFPDLSETIKWKRKAFRVRA